jgi:hypothetical protein
MRLHYSPLLLLATVAGMVLTYLVPPCGNFRQRRRALIGLRLGADGRGVQPTLGCMAVAVMGHRAACYCSAIRALTLDSAYQYVRGRGGSWKGRVQAKASGTR